MGYGYPMRFLSARLNALLLLRLTAMQVQSFTKILPTICLSGESDFAIERPVAAGLLKSQFEIAMWFL
jgi:hypothetical protein